MSETKTERQVAAIELLNELLGDDVHLCRIDEHRSTLAARLATLRAQIETQHLQMTVIAQDRRHKYTYVAESNGRALVRAREVVKLVETVAEQVKDIVERTEKLNRNQKELTTFITRLERLRSFVENIDRLEKLMLGREYERIGSLLLATQQFAEQFQEMRERSFVGEQLGRFDYLQKMLQRQVLELFDETMRRRGSVNAAQSINLAHAAVVIDVLGEASQRALIRWYCDRQLGDYKDVFRGNRELANLESIPKRYAWLKRLMVVYEAEHAFIFPVEWKVDQVLCLDFCAVTSHDIAGVMQSFNGAKINLTLLQTAVQQTRSFEQFLHRKYPKNPGLSISLAFEPFLFYFIDSHDQALLKFKSRLPVKLTLADFDASNVLTSASELFLLFREILQDISELSVKKPLADLCKMFGSHLGTYSKYLEERLPRMGKKPFVSFDVRTLCVVLNTTDYCYLTTVSMAERIREIIHPHFSESVAFDGAQQDFLVHVSVGIGRLHLSISSTLDACWTLMSSISWSGLKSVGDHSAYVSQIQRTLADQQPIIRSTLVGSKHYVALCHRLATSIVSRFSDNVKKIKHLNDFAAQQLLVDLEALRIMLLDLLRLGDYGALRTPFAKLVASETADVEGFLKCVMAPTEPASVFVQNYLLVRADVEESKFLAVLEVKGIRRTTLYLDEFRSHVPKRPSEQGRELKFFRIDEHLKKILQAVKL
ncbi:Vps53p [Paramicrosporidium saccamoebae]|uniref:Vps53p n=1 Tax=Paramicrosporidium saccamoebae TaxID=1246581 RepID=A0A2H9TIQ7_9FUNG|nr:Vps53p [Paramicrosporidium saccamoebae]